jgi:hypothetical protein
MKITKNEIDKIKEGRPSVDPIEKLRRATKRQKITASNLATEFAELGDNQAEIDSKKSVGRKSLSRKERLNQANEKLATLYVDILAYEKEHNIEHVDIEAVYDPLVENNTLKSVGRKGKDQFTDLDRKILLAQRAMADTIAEWEVTDDIAPIATSETETGKRKGRAPLTYPQRMAKIRQDIIDYSQAIKALEAKLSKTELMDRQVKLLKDAKREVVREIKYLPDDSPIEQINSLNSELTSLESEIKIVSARVNNAKKMEKNGWQQEVELATTAGAKLQSIIKRAEGLLFKKINFKTVAKSIYAG